jgi:hypothetical protein
MARYTNDVIGSSVFGVKANALQDKNDSFRTIGQTLLRAIGPVRYYIFAPFSKNKYAFKVIKNQNSKTKIFLRSQNC